MGQIKILSMQKKKKNWNDSLFSSDWKKVSEMKQLDSWHSVLYFYNERGFKTRT